MVSTVRLLKFSDGVAVGTPEVTKMASTGFVAYANSAAYLAAKGSAVVKGDAFYNTTSNVIQWYDGTAWVSIQYGPTVYSTQTLAAGASITLSSSTFIHYIPVIGTGAMTMANQLFGTTAPSDGSTIRLIGQSDSNTVTVPHYDSALGAVLNGECILSKYSMIELVYIGALSRYIELSRNA